MKRITRRGIGSVLGLALASLIVATGGAAWAQTLERTYLPPFEAAEEYLSGCDAPWCEGSSFADPSGELAADIQVVTAGIGRSDLAQGSVKITHVVDEPANEISVELRIHVDGAYASVMGGPFAEGTAKIGLEVWSSQAPWASRYVENPLATAEAPIGEAEAGEQDVVVSATLGDGKRLIPKGAIEITVRLIAEVSTQDHHSPSTSLADACSAGCVGAGKVEASISGLVQSVTVRESR
jgi:hypothetical protein